MLLLLSFSNVVLGQRFQKIYVGPGDDFGTVSVKTNDGGYILGGNKMLSAYTDMCVVRYSASGKVLWNQLYGNDREDGLSAILANPYGSYTLLGFMDNNLSTERYITILNIDDLGSIITYNFYKLTGSKKFFKPSRFIRLSDGGVFVVGSISTYPYSSNQADGFYMRINVDGTVAYAKLANYTQSDQLNACVELPNGNILITGHSLRDVGVHKVYIAMVDSWGNALVNFLSLDYNYTSHDCYYLPELNQIKVLASAQKVFGVSPFKPVIVNCDDAMNIISAYYYDFGNASDNTYLLSLQRPTISSGFYLAGNYNNDAIITRLNIHDDFEWMKVFGENASESVSYGALTVSNEEDIVLALTSDYSTYISSSGMNLMLIKTDTTKSKECFLSNDVLITKETIASAVFNPSLNFVDLGVQVFTTSFHKTQNVPTDIVACCFKPSIPQGIFDTICPFNEPTFCVPFVSNGPVNPYVTGMDIDIFYDTTYIKATGISFTGPIATRNGSVNPPITTDISVSGLVQVSINKIPNPTFFLNDSGNIACIEFQMKPNYTSGKLLEFINAGTIEYYDTMAIDRSCGLSDTASFYAYASVASSSISHVSCNAGSNASIDINSSAVLPATYSWSNGKTSEDVNSLNSGTYRLTITDAGSCSSTSSFVITQPIPFNIIANITDVSTSGGSDGAIDITVSGSNSGSYQYSWSNGKTIADISSLTAGTYTITLTDSKACTTTVSFQVKQQISVIGSLVHPSCFKGLNGSIALTASLGVLPYSYSWSNGKTNATLTALSAGTYFVTTSDAGIGNAIDTFILLQPDSFYIKQISKTDYTCLPISAGGLRVSVIGGTPLYALSWSNGGNSDTLPALNPTLYSITVTDQNNCKAEASFLISLIKPNTASALITNDRCNTNPYNLYNNLTVGYDTIGFWYELSSETIINNGIIDVSKLREGSSQYAYRIVLPAPCDTTETIVSIFVMPALSAGQGSNGYICSGSIDLNSLLTNADDGGMWIFIQEDSIVSNIFTPPGRGTYQMMYRHDTIAGCPESLSYSTITSDTTPPRITCPPDLHHKTNVLGNEYIVAAYELDPVKVSDDCNYTLSNTFNKSSTLQAEAIPNETTITWLIVDEAGGSSSCSFMVNVESFIPNIFTPNGDGFNDQWEFTLGRKFADAIVQVYNRWGQQVFVSESGYPSYWAGAGAPDGSYTYQIIYKGEVSFKGSVAIAR